MTNRRTDLVQQELARGLGPLFQRVTGLHIHVFAMDGEADTETLGARSLCPASPDGHAPNQVRRGSCQHCAEQRWRVGPTLQEQGRIFLGNCGRCNCWLVVRTHRRPVARLVIQTDLAPHSTGQPASGAEARGCVASKPSPSTDPRERPHSVVEDSVGAGLMDAGSFVVGSWDEVAGRDPNFGRAVALLGIVAYALEAALGAQRMQVALDRTQRDKDALLAQDARLRRALRGRMPELADSLPLPAGTPHGQQLIARVREFVLTHFHRPMGLAEAAASVNRAPTYISTLFARETGLSFHAYLEEVRMAEAQKLLRSPEHTVGEVACSVGYGSEDSFRHAFRKHTGFAPREWRRRRDHRSRTD